MGKKIYVALSIAGSDSGGGAGIQADLKTFFAHGVFGTTVITALTAQNTVGVYGIEVVSPEMIYLQAKAVFSDLHPDAVKIGMLYHPKTVEVVGKILRKFKPRWVVVDPVMTAKDGAELLSKDALELYKEEIIPFCSILTPNIPEAEALTQKKISDLEDMKKSAVYMFEKLKAKAILLKGGHLKADPIDVFFDGEKILTLPGKRIITKNTHGTGCTLSAAITANLALGYDLLTAVKRAKHYLEGAIAQGLNLGKGAGPLNHFWNVTINLP